MYVARRSLGSSQASKDTDVSPLCDGKPDLILRLLCRTHHDVIKMLISQSNSILAEKLDGKRASHFLFTIGGGGGG